MFTAKPEFVAGVRTRVEAHPAGIGEYELIKALQGDGLFDGWISGNASLGLFQKHFSVMHCLYRLRSEYAAQGRALAISPLAIQLLEVEGGASSQQQVSDDSGLHGFYSDWRHFAAATPDTVNDLLNNFWKRYLAIDATAAALQTLDLPAEAKWEDIQAGYRRLAAVHHPDKGGDPAQFAKVREAYEALKARYGR